MHSETNRFSAGLLTLAVHTLFFGVLYMGVHWQAQLPEGMEVELWSDLPGASAAPPPEAAPPQPVPAPQKEAAKPAPPAKADISLAQKKNAREAARQQPRKLSEAERKNLLKDMLAQSEQADQSALRENDARAEQAAKGAAAFSSEMNKYRALIAAKIRSHIIMPPDVPDNVEAEYVITLLPDGSLLGSPRLIKSSGNAAYDSAVERAIRKPGTLPLPEDESIRARFINPNQLRLKFSPRDGR